MHGMVHQNYFQSSSKSKSWDIKAIMPSGFNYVKSSSCRSKIIFRWDRKLSCDAYFLEFTSIKSSDVPKSVAKWILLWIFNVMFFF